MTLEEFKKRILNNKKIPKNTTVNGTLNLLNCTSLTALPEGLCVGGSLDLEGCTALKSLAGIKSVGDTLYVDECFIESYPFEELPLLINLPFKEEIKDIIKKRYQYDSRKIQKKNIK